jgi:hypothetical protein
VKPQHLLQRELLDQFYMRGCVTDLFVNGFFPDHNAVIFKRYFPFGWREVTGEYLEQGGFSGAIGA